MKTEFSVQAEEDLIEIYLYGVTNFGVEQAERYHLGLQNAVELLGTYPSIARERAEFTPPIRAHFHESHVIIYTADIVRIFIIRVLGARQDWLRILREH